MVAKSTQKASMMICYAIAMAAEDIKRQYRTKLIDHLRHYKVKDVHVKRSVFDGKCGKDDVFIVKSLAITSFFSGHLWP